MKRKLIKKRILKNHYGNPIEHSLFETINSNGEILYKIYYDHGLMLTKGVKQEMIDCFNLILSGAIIIHKNSVKRNEEI